MITKVCIVNNLYALLIYLLLHNKQDAIDNTFYIFEENIPDDITRHFKHEKVQCPHSKLKKIFYILYLHYLKRWPFKHSKVEFWGQDNITITSPIIKKTSIKILEDGVLNYTYKPTNKSHKILRKFIGGPLSSQSILGYSDNVSEIYLTGLSKIPKGIEGKTRIINLNECWNKCDYISTILQVFSISNDLLHDISSYNNLLLTQPLSEDGFITELEKIKIYRTLVKDIDNDTLLIKPHPRETTDYQRYFRNSYIFKHKIPMELLTLLNIKFNNIYTVFSTAAINFHYKTNIHFAGTRVHQNLINEFGDIEFSHGVIKTSKSSTPTKSYK